MRPNPTLLTFDTSAAHVAAALFSDGKISAQTFVEMKKGQAEHLFSILETVLPRPEWSALDGIVVGIGPGNFTGIRVSVAAARGLGLSLGIPQISVSNFEIMQNDAGHARCWVSLPAPRDTVYLQEFQNNEPVGDPRQVDPAGTDAFPFGSQDIIVGHSALLLAEASGARAVERSIDNPINALALIGASKFANQTEASRPAPLYVRPADASLPKEPPVVILP